MKLDIDFATHPAYAADVRPHSDEAEYLRIIGEVDTLSAELMGKTAKGSTLAERWGKFDAAAQPLRKAFDRALDADPLIDPRIMPGMKQAFRTAVKQLAEEQEWSRFAMKKPGDESAQAVEWAEEFAQVGFKQFHMSERWLAPLQDFIRDYVDQLQRKRESGSKELLLNEPGALCQAIFKDYAQSSGILDALSVRFGKKFDKVGFNLHLSCPGETWFHVYDDLGLPVTKTAQMHYDLAYEVPKAMVYLNDVAEGQGPFSFIPESHHWQDLGMSLTLRKQVTIALQQFCKDHGGPGGFRNPEARKAFASLPATIRATAHPGDHIQDHLPLSKELLALEKKVTGEKGCVGVFTGGHVLHRGGICTQGQRVALQVCFWPKDEVKLPKKEDLIASGQRAAKEPPKKSFFHRVAANLFPTAKVQASPAKPAKPAKPAPQAKVTEPATTYSNKRFSLSLKKVVGNAQTLSVVDVGGAGDVQPHWHRFHQAANYIVYEPCEQSWQKLTDRQTTEKYYRNFTYLQQALSGTGGPRTLYVTNAPTGSSLLPPLKGSAWDYPGNTYLYPLKEVPMDTHTLADSLAAVACDRVDAIKLDTQGTELEILQSMGDERLNALLLVEMEIGLMDLYAGSTTKLETVLPWFKQKGFVVLDMRTNRSIGNGSRVAEAERVKALGSVRNAPSIAQRLGEVDLIVARDPAALVESGASALEVRRLTALLCGYGFFYEALFTADHACKAGILTVAELDEINAAIGAMNSEAKLEVADVEQWLEKRQGYQWGQYMWVPYPSA